MNKKVLIITTGGTISMKYQAAEGIVPADDLVGFLQSFPKLSQVAQIEVMDYSNIPSPYMTPAKMFELAKVVDLSSVDYDGIVITHGTDTLEETAYLLDIVLTTRKPVVFTAAMRSEGDLGLDGPRNIVGAVRVAAHSESIDRGVLVVMNDEIHAAHDVIKTDTGKVNSFDSPSYGILGIVDPDEVVFHRHANQRESVWTDKLEYNIDLIRISAGMDDRFIQTSIEKGAKAIVIEAFGRGNLPEELMPAIKKAIAKDIVVVIVSRASTGRVLPEYGYVGGGLDLQRAGAILGGDLKGHKARLKLMALFGKYRDPSLVKKFFLSSIK